PEDREEGGQQEIREEEQGEGDLFEVQVDGARREPGSQLPLQRERRALGHAEGEEGGRQEKEGVLGSDRRGLEGREVRRLLRRGALPRRRQELRRGRPLGARP